jgi:hypothetical protein
MQKPGEVRRLRLVFFRAGWLARKDRSRELTAIELEAVSFILPIVLFYRMAEGI